VPAASPPSLRTPSLRTGSLGTGSRVSGRGCCGCSSAEPLPGGGAAAGACPVWPPVCLNLHPSGFDTIMPKTLATATVDRLLHHAHIVLTEGTSLRLAEATAGKGVIPLT
jgi:hypothetical protein